MYIKLLFGFIDLVMAMAAVHLIFGLLLIDSDNKKPTECLSLEMVNKRRIVWIRSCEDNNVLAMTFIQSLAAAHCSVERHSIMDSGRWNGNLFEGLIGVDIASSGHLHHLTCRLKSIYQYTSDLFLSQTAF